jgi:hypothetical protein
MLADNSRLSRSPTRTRLKNGARRFVAEDDGSFGMGRMTQLKSRLQNPDAFIQAFRKYDDAVGWLMR